MSRSSNRPLRKSKTLMIQKNQLMNNIPMAKNNNNVVEFPISPQLMYGEEIVHFSHPRHPLSHMCLPDLFTCNGCKEYGAGMRYCCQQCDFQLHEFCALSPPALKAHPFHSHHQLLFYAKPVKGGITQSKCDVCAKSIKGFGFRCSICNVQIHPCCAMLSLEMNIPSLHPHSIRMVMVSSSNIGDVNCGECKRKRSGRIYRCLVCDYELHAVCAKNIKNGLIQNGHKLGTEKQSKIGTAARIASQVVVEFLGGIIEGIGEGVGEALVQNMTKGKAPPLHH